MNEQDLRNAFEHVLVASSPPPPMDPGQALGVAHRARSKRRASLVGAAVAVLVVGLGVGTALAVNPGLRRDVVAGAGKILPTSVWGPKWPAGQTDRTATSGPQADRAQKLLEELKGVVPPGYEAVQLKSAGGRDMQTTQGQVASDRGETPEVWEYTAQTPMRKDGKVGWLLAEVSTPNPALPDEPCELAKTFWGMGGECQVLDVGGLRVGVVRHNTSDRDQFDKWATYRALDGTVVTIAQDDKYNGGEYPELDVPVFTEQQLAGLATDPRFRVGG
ncbi:hypothetical protein ABZX92_07945 [Lentzea sp. NPDC006480]|uniref:hypothetical protein n=1 Tax=Lentzea sp. NPDC006480 TaxID=3157176 RepID=UPI0033B488E6